MLLGLIYNITSVLKTFFHGSQACFFVSCCWEFFFSYFTSFFVASPYQLFEKNQSSSEFCSQFVFPFIQISVTKTGTFTIQITKHLDLVHKCTAIQKVRSRLPNVGVATVMVTMSWSHIFYAYHDMHFI